MISSSSPSCISGRTYRCRADVSADEARASRAARARAVIWIRFVSAAIWRQTSVNNSVSSWTIRSSAPRTFFSISRSSGVVNRSALASVCRALVVSGYSNRVGLRHFYEITKDTIEADAQVANTAAGSFGALHRRDDLFGVCAYRTKVIEFS